MPKILIATLISTVALTGTVFAQATTAPSTNTPAAPTGSMETTPNTTPAPTTDAPGAMGSMQSEGGFFTYQEGSQMLGSGLMGANVIGAEGDDIGEVDDLLLDGNGQVMAVVVGVGGFLGIGEKDVAIANDQLEFVLVEDMAAGGAATAPAAGIANAPAGTTTSPTGTTPVPAPDGSATGTDARGTAGNAMTRTGDTRTTMAPNYGWGWTGAGIDHIQVAYTREQLEAAPAFEYAE